MREEIKLELLKCAQELPPEQLPRFFGDLEEIRCAAQIRIAAGAQEPAHADELLTVEQASAMLNISEDMLYRHEYSFTRHINRLVRFSRKAIEHAIQQDDLNPLRSHGNVTHSRWPKS